MILWVCSIACVSAQAQKPGGHVVRPKNEQRQELQRQQKRSTSYRPTTKKTIVYDGMKYEISKNVAILLKGKNEETIVIPDAVKDSGKYYDVVEIGQGAFMRFSKVCNVRLPSRLKVIGSSAFYGCSLGDIILPASIEILGSDCFRDCYKLSSLYIPANVRKINGAICTKGERTSLKRITVDKNNKYFDSRFDCNAVINSRTNELILGCMNTEIPEGVTTIGEYAFINIILQEIKIPNSVKTIGRYAFACCEINTLSLPSSLIKIEDGAFEDNKMKEVTIPQNVRELGDMAFWSDSLKTAYIPSKCNIVTREQSQSSTFKSSTRVIRY